MGKNKRYIVSYVLLACPLLVSMFVLGVLTRVFGLWLWIGILCTCWYLLYKYRGEIRKTRIEDWVNPKKWWSVVYSWIMEALFPWHVLEQLFLRRYDEECRACVAKGSCVHCGCNMRKIYTPGDSCSNGNWGAMEMDAEKYRKIREAFPVRIEIKYVLEEIDKAVASRVGMDNDDPRSGIVIVSDTERCQPCVVLMKVLDEQCEGWRGVVKYVDRSRGEERFRKYSETLDAKGIPAIYINGNAVSNNHRSKFVEYLEKALRK